MANLVQLSELSNQRGYNFRDENIYDPTGETAYGMNGEKVGKVDSVLADGDTGKLRYLVVDVGNWFSSKQVLVPVGMARIEQDGVYFDNLSKEQVRSMQEYRRDIDITDEYETQNRGILGTGSSAGTAAAMGTSTGAVSGGGQSSGRSDAVYDTPKRLQLLEERLVVDKRREKAGEVVISKHVETRPENVSVDVSHDEVVIERRPAGDARPVEGNATLGAGSETIRVDIEAERADVRKQAYVAEEVEVSKRRETETKTVTEQVGREVLDVERTGDVKIEGDTTDTSAASRKKSNR